MRLRSFGITLQQRFNDIITPIDVSTRTDFPEGIISHTFEIGARGSQFAPVKDRFAGGKLFKNVI
jgi:hypothetical protein